MTDFLSMFAEALEMSPDQISPDDEIRALERWDSIAALGVLAMVEQQFGVQLSGDDFGSVTTVADLERLVTSRARA